MAFLAGPGRKPKPTDIRRRLWPHLVAQPVLPLQGWLLVYYEGIFGIKAWVGTSAGMPDFIGHQRVKPCWMGC